LRELRPKHVLRLRKGMGVEEAFLTYVMLGGIPHYHVVTSWCRSVEELLWEAFLSPKAVLRDEPHFILREEFRDPATYYGILQAIARGANTPSKIADATGMHRQHVSKYLTVLEDVGFIGRDVPILSKKGVYVIKDNLMMTWFNIVEPILSTNPYPEKEECIPTALSKLTTQASRTYEELAKEFAIKWGLKHGVRFDLIGRYIHKGTEIDVVAVSREKHEVHIFEVKWKDLTPKEISSITKTLLKKASTMPDKIVEEHEIIPHIIAKKIKNKEQIKPETHVHDLTEVIETI
jgi:AAA+ ATPase superfamily predicted ATPase